MIIEFKCDCGLTHILRFDKNKEFIGRDEKIK